MSRGKYSLIAFLLIAVCLFAACSEPETGVQTTETEAVVTEPEKILPNLPATDFNGEECRILVPEPGAGDWEDWGSRDMIAEEQNGETINDAVYRRNLHVEETYKVKITGIQKSGLAASTAQMVLAGTDDYHIVTDYVRSMIPSITSGYLVNLNTVDYMDLSQIWYDQQCVKENAVMGKIFLSPAI